MSQSSFQPTPMIMRTLKESSVIFYGHVSCKHLDQNKLSPCPDHFILRDGLNLLKIHSEDENTQITFCSQNILCSLCVRLSS